MSPVVVDGAEVAQQQNRLRIEAERSLTSVQSALADKRELLARLVVAWRATMTDAGRRLVALQVALTRAMAAQPDDPRWAGLSARVVQALTAWTALAQGYAAYERPATDAELGQKVEVGVAPAVLVVGIVGAAVIALSITGVAWAVVHYEKARTLQQEVALLERDPTLAPMLTSLNQSAGAAPAKPTAGVGMGLAFALGLGALGTLALWFATRSSR